MLLVLVSFINWYYQLAPHRHMMILPLPKHRTPLQAPVSLIFSHTYYYQYGQYSTC